MTKTKTLNERIADTDRTLRAEVENAEDAAETAILRLDKHRYACIKHPDGPKKTQNRLRRDRRRPVQRDQPVRQGDHLVPRSRFHPVG